MPSPAATRWTVEQVRAMQGEERAWPRYELVDGVLLVTPGPRPVHQEMVMQLLEQLAPYVRRHRLGRLLTSPADVELERGTIVQPDVFVVPASIGRIRQWPDANVLLLAVEVLSPSSARADRVWKRRLYQRAGVPDYWVVDTDARMVERWTPTDVRPEPLDERLTWHPAGAAEPLVLDLPALFAEAIGDAEEPDAPHP